MTEAVIDVRDVSTTLGGHSIHRDLNLSVARGEVVALIGGSGTGKSVLLREIIGLLKPQAGSIERTIGNSDLPLMRNTGL